MKVEVPREVFGVRKWLCKVRSNESVATFIKELVLELPQGETLDFRAGGYIVIECPPHHVQFRDFDIAPQYRPDWDRYNLWRYASQAKQPVSRAYSMASFPLEREIIMLNVRIGHAAAAGGGHGAARHHVLLHLLAEAGRHGHGVRAVRGVSRARD